MLGSASLDLAIGLVLFFLLVSLMCSAIREAGETFLKSRARDLESGLRMMLDDKDGTVTMPSLMSHGLMASLFQGSYNPNFLKSGWWDKALHLPPSRRGQFPSYIP